MGRELTFVFDSPVPAQLPSHQEPAAPADSSSMTTTVKKSGGRKKKDPPAEPTSQRRQSSRSTKGRGGAALQLQKAGEKVQEAAVRRTERFKLPEVSAVPGDPAIADNPMAPDFQQKRGRKKKEMPVTPQQTYFTSGPEQASELQFIVPPGTEPPLNPIDRCFGFQPPPFQPPQTPFELPLSQPTQPQFQPLAPLQPQPSPVVQPDHPPPSPALPAPPPLPVIDPQLRTESEDMCCSSTVLRVRPRPVRKGSRSVSQTNEPFIMSRSEAQVQQPSRVASLPQDSSQSCGRNRSLSHSSHHSVKSDIERESESESENAGEKKGDGGKSSSVSGDSDSDSEQSESSADEDRGVRVTLRTAAAAGPAPIDIVEDPLSRFKVSSRSTDVVKEHWNKNRRPKAPNPRKLQGLKQHRHIVTQGGSHHQSRRASARGESLSDSDVESGSNPKKRGKSRVRNDQPPRKRQRNATTDDDEESDLWKEVIVLAKSRAHLFLLTENAFPSYDQYLTEAADCIYEACVELQEQGITPPLQRPEPIPLKYVEKVYGDQSTFRGDVKRHGTMFIENLIVMETAGIRDGHECRRKVREAVAKLRKRFAFLHGRDSDGRRARFRGQWLQQLCTTYLFKDGKHIGNLYPDCFKDGVPVETVAFFGTVIQNILDEWKAGKYAQCKFFASDYKKTYEKILRRARKADAHPTRGPAFRQLRQSWTMLDSHDSDSFDESNIDSDADSLDTGFSES